MLLASRKDRSKATVAVEQELDRCRTRKARAAPRQAVGATLAEPKGRASGEHLGCS